ncbi:MAG: hypothetical protein ACRDJF_06815, partial [Actinomycetota bacterium]
HERAEAETKGWKRQWDAYDTEVRAAGQAGPDAVPSSHTSPRPSYTDPGADGRAAAHRLLK